MHTHALSHTHTKVFSDSGDADTSHTFVRSCDKRPKAHKMLHRNSAGAKADSILRAISGACESACKCVRACVCRSRDEHFFSPRATLTLRHFGVCEVMCVQKDIRVSEERSVFLPSLRRRPSFISRSTSRRGCLCVCVVVVVGVITRCRTCDWRQHGTPAKGGASGEKRDTKKKRKEPPKRSGKEETPKNKLYKRMLTL